MTTRQRKKPAMNNDKSKQSQAKNINKDNNAKLKAILKERQQMTALFPFLSVNYS